MLVRLWNNQFFLM